jgi:hypothetical protein
VAGNVQYFLKEALDFTIELAVLRTSLAAEGGSSLTEPCRAFPRKCLLLFAERHAPKDPAGQAPA